METLRTLFERLEKYYPEAVSDSLREYCTGDNPEFFTGVFSLKFIIYRLRELYPDDIFTIFRSIAENIIVYKKDPRKQKLHRLPCLAPYRKDIAMKIEVPVEVGELERFQTESGYMAVINDTPYNITKKIFGTGYIDIIVFFNPDTKGWGIVFRQGEKLKEMQPRIEELYNTLIQTDYSFEVFSKDNMINLIINHGKGKKIDRNFLVNLVKEL